MKKYSKKFITEAIKYWAKQLSIMDEQINNSRTKRNILFTKEFINEALVYWNDQLIKNDMLLEAIREDTCISKDDIEIDISNITTKLIKENIFECDFTKIVDDIYKNYFEELSREVSKEQQDEIDRWRREHPQDYANYKNSDGETLGQEEHFDDIVDDRNSMTYTLNGLAGSSYKIEDKLNMTIGGMLDIGQNDENNNDENIIPSDERTGIDDQLRSTYDDDEDEILIYTDDSIDDAMFKISKLTIKAIDDISSDIYRSYVSNNTKLQPNDKVIRCDKHGGDIVLFIIRNVTLTQ